MAEKYREMLVFAFLRTMMVLREHLVRRARLVTIVEKGGLG